jgi:hypothetical protein
MLNVKDRRALCQSGLAGRYRRPVDDDLEINLPAVNALIFF